MIHDMQLILMAGIDIPVPELQITIRPPTIKDIAYMGESDFFMAVQYICLEKEAIIQDETLLKSLTNFQVLMKVLQDQQKKLIITTLLMILLPDYKVGIIPGRSIIITREEMEPVMIDSDNFGILQDVLRQVLCVNSIFQRDNIIYKPSNALAKKIADKLMRGRQKVTELKSKEGIGSTSVLTRYLSILTIGTNTLSINDCINLTLFQLFDLMERYTAFVNWDIDLKVRLAGGKPDKEVETWMKDLHSEI